MTSTELGVFDLETTGVDAATDRIVTAYVGTLDDAGKVTGGREWMIAPDGYVISDGAAAVHGITTERALAEGRPFAEVLPEIVAALAAVDGPVSGHNLSYDFTMLVHEMVRAGIPGPVEFVEGLDLIDTFVLDKELDTYRRGSRTLTSIAEVYGVELPEEEAHGAAADAIAAGRIAQVLLAGLPQLGSMSQAELTRKQRAWSRAQRVSLRDYKRRNGAPNFEIDLNWPLYESALAHRSPREVSTF